MQWGDPPQHEWRDEGEDIYECRTEVLALVECPKCGKDVDLEAETDEWTQGDDGRWYHESYGPATGVCCGLLLVDDFNGTRAYVLDGTSESSCCDGCGEYAEDCVCDDPDIVV